MRGLAAGLGIFAGLAGWPRSSPPSATTTFEDPATDFAIGFPAAAPLWFAVLLMIGPGGLANIESAAMCVLQRRASTSKPRSGEHLTRAQLTFVISAIGLAVAYVALIAFDAIESIEAFATLMLVSRHPVDGDHDHRSPDAPRLVRPHGSSGVARTARRRASYWFSGGFNLKAFVAWGVSAVAVGMLFTSTSDHHRAAHPGHVSGIDLSFISAALVGGVLYFALVKIFPERGVTRLA